MNVQQKIQRLYFKPFMTNIAYYTSMLIQCLEPILPGYVEFYSNPKRLTILNRLLTDHLKVNTADILNVGCGAFAIEMLLPLLDKHQITSFDYMPQYETLYGRFQSGGYLQNTTFFVGNAQSVGFDDNSFDLIIMNDIFMKMPFPCLAYWQNILLF